MAQWKKRTATARAAAALLTCVVLFAGCTSRPAQPPEDQIRKQAASDARQVQHDVKEAGKEAKQALFQARRETEAAVAGAREGLKSDRKEPGLGYRDAMVDINHASPEELERLPGVHASTAHRIIAGRPYTAPEDLAKRRILSSEVYENIEDRLEAER